jgi:protein deglycase
MKAMVLLSDGFDEIEAFTIVNVLRRAGVETHMISLAEALVTGQQKIKTHVDKRMAEIDPYSYDMLILPSSQKLLNSGFTIELIKNFNKKNKFIAAINTSSIALADAGILEDKIATVFPGFENRIPRPRAAKVVVAKNVITARGPASAMDFSLKLAEVLAGKAGLSKLKRSLAVDEYA